VIDALSPLGIRHLDMPYTAQTVWRAIQGAKGGAKGAADRTNGSNGKGGQA
jgi:carbon-monoxide dehydrogenase large subunit